MDRLNFPSYTQIPSRLPIRWWQAIRAGSIVAALIVRKAASTTAGRSARCCCWARCWPRSPAEGFGVPGTAVLRSAEDAIGLRAFAQRPANPPRGDRRRRPRGHLRAAQDRAEDRRARALGPAAAARQLDARAARILRDHLEGLGLEFEMEAQVAAVEASGRLRAVRLDDGRPLEAHILLVAAGIQPNVELAVDAGLRVKRGVLVDDRMRTDDPVVLAAGDVAEHEGRLDGLCPRDPARPRRRGRPRTAAIANRTDVSAHLQGLRAGRWGVLAE